MCNKMQLCPRFLGDFLILLFLWLYRTGCEKLDPFFPFALLLRFFLVLFFMCVLFIISFASKPIRICIYVDFQFVSRGCGQLFSLPMPSPRAVPSLPLLPLSSLSFPLPSPFTLSSISPSLRVSYQLQPQHILLMKSAYGIMLHCIEILSKSISK